GLEEEAGDPDREEQADEEDVAAPVRGAVVAARGSVHPVVAEAPWVDHPAAHHHRPEAEEEGGAEGVEGHLEGEVEAAVPEPQPRVDVAGEVEVDGDDDGADEEGDEATHDPQVGEAGPDVTAA